jgi:hypothetical protein
MHDRARAHHDIASSSQGRESTLPAEPEGRILPSVAEPPAVPFDCPNCGAKYKVVGVERPPPRKDRKLRCKHCAGPLQPYEGQFLLKYFLVERPGEQTRRINLTRRDR